MNVQRFDFKEFSAATVTIAARGKPPFKPTGKSKDDAPPPPPTFSEAELKAAEKAAQQKGFLEGEKEGRRQAESEQAMVNRKLAETVEKFASRLVPMFADYRKMALALQEQAPKMALAIARKVAGEALQENARAAIDEMVARCSEIMTKEPKVSITVHESLGDALAKKTEELAARLQSAGNIVILRDPDMPAADCRIEWNQGSMERQTAEIWKQVEQMIGNITATATRDTKEQLETLKKDVVDINPADRAGDSAEPKNKV